MSEQKFPPRALITYRRRTGLDVNFATSEPMPERIEGEYISTMEHNAALAEKDRFIKEIQGTLELSVDAVLSSKKKCDEPEDKLGRIKVLLENEVCQCEEEDWGKVECGYCAALFIIKSPAKSEGKEKKQFWCTHVGGFGPPFPYCKVCSLLSEQTPTADSYTTGKDGIGWDKNGVDDSPAHDSWRKK